MSTGRLKLTQLHPFRKLTEAIELPEKFPYLYTHKPHQLCYVASKELQSYLAQQSSWNEQLGVNGEPNTAGKMFGVLVVRQSDGTLAYLAGFSGAIGTCNTHPHFVPPVVNLLNPDGFFKQGEKKLNSINREIKQLEESSALSVAKEQVKDAENNLKANQLYWKKELKEGKELRKQERSKAQENLTGNELNEKLNELNKASQLAKIKAKKQIAELYEQLAKANEQLEATQQPLVKLKQLRKEQSAQLQNHIFEQFQLLNSKQELKNVAEIFKEQGEDNPPAGTGDCAAPKLLQFAFQHKLEPIAMTEFWWGAPPKSEIRKHKQFYPPCLNKCAPIMKHMLQYIEQEANPINAKITQANELSVIFEDQWLIAINKPENCLSVPGKTHHHSVWHQLKKMRPNAKELLLVHRLDMATSGVLLAAKDPETHKALQQQFIKRTTQKCYLAILDGIIEKDSGTIDLPLRTDINNRPQQLVCYEHGKSARTHWKVIERKDGKTYIEFYPITGRTHQLRVHAAHAQGLNTAIVGDELYGKSSDRLYLHSYWLKIIHPHSQKEITLRAPKAF